jgi:hypothetical protein
MLTYATVTDFRQALTLSEAEYLSAEEVKRKSVERYLSYATRFIDRFTRRKFYPWRELRKAYVPYTYYDLRIRRIPSIDLYLDNDLLEVEKLVDGQGNTLVEDTDFFLHEHNIWPKYGIALKFPNYWSGIFSSAQVLHMEQPEILITAIWGFHDEPRYPAEAFIDTLDTAQEPLDATETDITVTDADGVDEFGELRFDVGYLIRIEDEFMEVTAIDANTNVITVIRGIRGTLAVTHVTGIAISRWNVPHDIREACLDIAKITRERDTQTGGRIGISEMSIGTQIRIPDNTMGVIKNYVRRNYSNYRG